MSAFFASAAFMRSVPADDSSKFIGVRPIRNDRSPTVCEGAWAVSLASVGLASAKNTVKISRRRSIMVFSAMRVTA